MFTEKGIDIEEKLSPDLNKDEDNSVDIEKELPSDNNSGMTTEKKDSPESSAELEIVNEFLIERDRLNILFVYVEKKNYRLWRVVSVKQEKMQIKQRESLML